MNDLRNPLSGVLYHCTVVTNWASIDQLGIMPRTLTKTGQNRTYAVRIGMLDWSIDHVAKRHNVGKGEVIVCMLVRSQDWSCYNRDIWYTEFRQRPDKILLAESLLKIIK